MIFRYIRDLGFREIGIIIKLDMIWDEGYIYLFKFFFFVIIFVLCVGYLFFVIVYYFRRFYGGLGIFN